MLMITHSNENSSSYKMTTKQKPMQRLAAREKGERSSRFLIQQKTMTGKTKMATHGFIPMEMSNASQKTYKHK